MEWTRSTFTPHPEGVFKAVFVDWEEVTGQYGMQAKCSFDTEELMDDGRPFRISAWVTPSLHEKSKAAKLLRALGEDPEELDTEEFTLDDYINRKLQVVVEHYKGADGTSKAKITNFLPLKKGGAKGQPQPAVAAAKPGGDEGIWAE